MIETAVKLPKFSDQTKALIEEQRANGGKLTPELVAAHLKVCADAKAHLETVKRELQDQVVIPQ